VDDNEAIRAFLKHFFRLENLPVEIIDSARTAWERFQAAPQDYSMLLTDCEMPGMTGLELAKRVRQVRADLPMVIFSTSVAVHGPKHFATQGFVAALPKPVALDTLRSTIRNALVPACPSAGGPPAQLGQAQA
jgi:DNA-binding NtrC family response regulator